MTAVGWREASRIIRSFVDISDDKFPVIDSAGGRPPRDFCLQAYRGLSVTTRRKYSSSCTELILGSRYKCQIVILVRRQDDYFRQVGLLAS